MSIIRVKLLNIKGSGGVGTGRGCRGAILSFLLEDLALEEGQLTCFPMVP